MRPTFAHGRTVFTGKPLPIRLQTMKEVDMFRLPSPTSFQCVLQQNTICLMPSHNVCVCKTRTLIEISLEI